MCLTDVRLTDSIPILLTDSTENMCLIDSTIYQVQILNEIRLGTSNYTQDPNYSNSKKIINLKTRIKLNEHKISMGLIANSIVSD